MRHRLYMLGRVLAGCVVQSVTVCNSTANGNQWNVGFDWFAAILRRYSEHFKDAAAYLYPKDDHGHVWTRIIEAAFTGCSEFSCQFSGGAGRPRLSEVLQHVPLEKCREIDVLDVSNVAPDAVINWLAEPTSDVRSLTIKEFDMHTEALIDRLVTVYIPGMTPGQL